MVIVDSHQHFWDPLELGLSFPPDASILNRPYLPDDLRGEIRTVGVDYTICVQGYPQNLMSNRWMFNLANVTEFVAGVVGWVDLQDPVGTAVALDEMKNQPKFVGIRHIVEDEPDESWIIRPAVLASLQELAERNLTFDMLVGPPHLRNVLGVMRKVPGLRMVIDHIGKPPIVGGWSRGWAEDMKAIADCGPVFCKLSGMITKADRYNWRSSDLEPYVRHVTDAFGWDRTMFGSDWPVCNLAGSYQRVWEAVNVVLDDMTREQRAKVFGENAVRFYALKIDANSSRSGQYSDNGIPC